MKILRCLLPVVAAVTLLSPAATYAHLECNDGFSSEFEQELNERDWDALYDYINTKRTINVQEKACNLTISGDVRSDWRHTNERDCHGRRRGGDAFDEHGIAKGRNDFDIEFNLRFDYVCDRAWAVAHLEFDNSAGVWNDHGCGFREVIVDGETIRIDETEALHGSGRACNINLKKAYMGYNICCDGCTRFDVELGRRNLYNVFDSEVQFLSRFDGLLLKYDTCWDCVGDWYVHLGGFVVDQRVNHFAWVIETGFLNIMDYGFDFKYSFIDWRKNGHNRCFAHNPEGAKFLVSQFTFAYNFDPEVLCCNPGKLFGAVLFNSNAHKTFNRKSSENFGWYAGFTIGDVVREGDWAFTVQYQYVETLAVPDDDVSGIGRGNVLNTTVVGYGNGNTNYKGWRLEALYALTDNLTLDTRIEWSREIVGDRHHYSQFRLEAIYAF